MVIHPKITHAREKNRETTANNNGKREIPAKE